MLTKDISQELREVFESLEQEGKTPTMATVKARLTSSVPMPALIAALKSWKSVSRVPKVEVQAEEQNDSTTINLLVEQIQRLTQRVEALEQLVKTKESK